MKPGLTPRMLDLLEYLRGFIGREGHPPSYDQMAAALGLKSKAYAHKLAGGLMERGYIRRLKNRPRSIVLIEEDERFAPAVEARIAAYCRRHRVEREAAVSRAVEAFFGSAA